MTVFSLLQPIPGQGVTNLVGLLILGLVSLLLAYILIGVSGLMLSFLHRVFKWK